MANQSNKMKPMDAILMSVGAIIGAGVFSMTGVAVGAAGPGVPISFLIAGLAAMMVNLPYMVVSSALPARGAQYLHVARFVSPLFGFLLVWNLVLECIYLSVLGISAGQYLPAIIPALTPKMAGAITVIGLTGACLLNVKTSAKVQNAMVILVLVALALFVAMGIPYMKYWSFKDMFSVKGLAGILVGVSYVRSAAYGGTAVVNLAGEIENAGRTVPRSIAVSTMGVSLLYALVAMVAVGVVPWEQMIQQPLSVAAKAYMPSWAFNFFVIGGALFAVLTTILAFLMDISRAIWAAADDGMFPEWLKVTNKYGVPYRIIIIMGAIGLTPILLALPLDYVFAVLNAPGMLLGLLATLPALVAPSKLPKKFEQAWFKMPTWLTWTLVLANIGLTFFLSYNLFLTLTLPTILGIVAFYGGGILYFYLRVNKLKNEGTNLIEEMSAYDPSWVSE